MSEGEYRAMGGCTATVDHDRNVPDVDLLSPLTLRGFTFRNRIAVSPMCQYCAEEGLADEQNKARRRSVNPAAEIR